MKKCLPLLLVVLLSACAPLSKYNYQSQASSDPEFIFGDRFGGGSVTSPARSFKVNIVDPNLNKCSDYAVVGTTSNHWMGTASKTIQIKTPAGKAVALSGGYVLSTGFSITTCMPPAVRFFPKNGSTYSVDVGVIDKRCMLSIVQRLPDGKDEPVSGETLGSDCQK
jgi:hypothetical protein